MTTLSEHYYWWRKLAQIIYFWTGHPGLLTSEYEDQYEDQYEVPNAFILNADFNDNKKNLKSSRNSFSFHAERRSPRSSLVVGGPTTLLLFFEGQLATASRQTTPDPRKWTLQRPESYVLIHNVVHWPHKLVFIVFFKFWSKPLQRLKTR